MNNINTDDLFAQIRALRRLLNKDLKDAARSIPEKELRFLVGLYYSTQEMRINVEGKLRSIEDKPHALLITFLNLFAEIEKDIQASLDVYTHNSPTGNRFRQIRGIGPVLTAGWLAHVSVHKASNCSKVLSFGGYNPNMVWEKGQKRPYNADFKLILTKMGRAFVFLANRQSYFGQIYKDHVAAIKRKNDAGLFADRCAHLLATRRYNKETAAYKAYVQGRYPAAHINASARLKTVALAVGILHREHHKQVLGTYPCVPYPCVMVGDGQVSGDMMVPLGAHTLIDIDHVLNWERTAPKTVKDAVHDEDISDAMLPEEDE